MDTEERGGCLLLVGIAVVVYIVAGLAEMEEAAKHEEPTGKEAAQAASPAAEDVRPKEPITGPISVASFYQGDIKFPRIGGDGLVTTELHFFREMLPEKAKVFTVNRDSEVRGTILEYRLRHVATGEVYPFEDVEAKKIGAEWTITQEGWRKIKEVLQAKLRVSLGGPI